MTRDLGCLGALSALRTRGLSLESDKRRNSVNGGMRVITADWWEPIKDLFLLCHKPTPRAGGGGNIYAVENPWGVVGSAEGCLPLSSMPTSLQLD